MSKSTFTPGPWRLTSNMHGVDNVPVDGVEDMTGYGIANCGTGGIDNARLIAAAPDLLMALEALTKWGEAAQLGNSKRSKQWSMFEAARAAIAKAKGE